MRSMRGIGRTQIEQFGIEAGANPVSVMFSLFAIRMVAERGQECSVAMGAAHIFQRARASTIDDLGRAPRFALNGFRFFSDGGVIPAVPEVVPVEEARARFQDLLQSNLAVIGGRALISEVQHVIDLEHGVGHAIDQEVVEMGVFSAEGRLQDMAQLAQ